MKIIILLLSIICILSISGCVTKIDPYQEDISKVELFQKAYEASDLRDHALAMSYYQAYIERFPDDIKGCLWAEYEIAFLYHKMGNDEKALELFDELLKKYEQDDSEQYPEGPKVLAEKVIKNIARKKNNKSD